MFMLQLLYNLHVFAGYGIYVNMPTYFVYVKCPGNIKVKTG